MHNDVALIMDLKRALARVEKKLRENQDFITYLSLKSMVESMQGSKEYAAEGRQMAAEANSFPAYNDNKSLPHAPVYGVKERPATTPKAVLKSKVSQLLIDRGKPVKLTDILHHLGSIGVNVGGSDPLRNLSAKLSQMDEFISLPGQGWVLRESLESHGGIFG